MIRVISGTREISGWDSVSLGLSLSTLCNGFQISQFPAEGLGYPLLLPGDPVKIYVDDELVIDGYVDGSAPAFSANSHTIEISGREKTADLVDCSFEKYGTNWKNKTAAQIISAICAAFGLSFSPNGISPGKPLPKFCAEPGSSCADMITDVCRQRDLLCASFGTGKLMFYDDSKYGYADDALEQGVNLISGSASFSNEERFSLYSVLCSSEPGCKRAGSACDPSIGRTRPLVIVEGNYGSIDSAEKRAEQEAHIRAAKSAECSVEVQGWRQKTGRREIWKPGLLVMTRIPAFFGNVDVEMLVNAVELGYDSSGESTSLSLVRPDFYARPTEKGTKGKKPGKKDPWDSVRRDIADYDARNGR